MIWFLSASLAVLAVDVTGMPPQIARVRKIAAERHLPLLCQGIEGGQTVVRIGLPRGTSPNEISHLKQQLNPVVNSIRDVDPKFNGARSCKYAPTMAIIPRDLPDPELGSAVQDLMFGPAPAIAKLLPIAKSCGYSRALTRPINESDRKMLALATNPPRVERDWQTLDAGQPTDAAGIGPLTCWLKLGVAAPMRTGS